MKVVIPNVAAPDSFVDNVAVTLRAMGHTVLTRPPGSNRWMNSPVRRIGLDAVQKVLPGRLTVEERWLLGAARSFKPDLVLALTQALGEETLAQLKRLGVGACVAWWGDTPANMRGLGLLSTGWDAIYLKDRRGVDKFRTLGLNTHHLNEAMNPVWHRPIAEQSSDAVVIAGTFYGFRQFLTMRLIDAGVPVALYGGRLPRWTRPEIAERHTHRFIVRDDKSRVFGSALACINSTALSEGDSMNCRAFEIAGAGGLQLLEYRSAVEECFEPGMELLTFRTVEELLEQLEWARRNPDAVRTIRLRGAQRALAEHTYEQRLRTILKAIA